MKPQIIFFDCWYTLFTSDIVDDLKRMAELVETPFDRAFVKRFEQAFMTTPAVDLQAPAEQFVTATGAPHDPVLARQIASLLEAGLDRQRPYPDSLPELDRLAQTYRLGLISNTSRPAFDRLRQQYRLDERFDVMLPSYEIGILKPDPRMFEEALRRAGVAANEAVMVGDSPLDDFEAAQAVGINAVLIDRRSRHPHHPQRITDVTQLESALASFSNSAA